MILSHRVDFAAIIAGFPAIRIDAGAGLSGAANFSRSPSGH
jgi:hypothetical protein